MPLLKVECNYCHAIFKAPQWSLRRGESKFCSKDCANANLRAYAASPEGHRERQKQQIANEEAKRLARDLKPRRIAKRPVPRKRIRFDTYNLAEQLQKGMIGF